MIAAAFYPERRHRPHERLQDQRVREPVGGRRYEPQEENPMIGFRGASRYYDPRYRDGFALECRAMKKVRDEMGLTNVKLMVPFCRTVEEGRRVLDEMATARPAARRERARGLRHVRDPEQRDPAPTEFAEIFDGFSIGSNDLTQLDPRRRPRLGDRRPHLRRAQPGREDDDRHGDRAAQGDGPQDRHLRPGAERLPRVRRSSWSSRASTASRSTPTR